MKKKKILIVEDEYIGAMGLAETLGDWDYETCEIATTGPVAIRIAEEQRPDVVLMDIGLRGKMNGVEAAREIQGRLKVPVIFMSGYSEDRVKDFRGKFYFVSKPLNLIELEAILEAL